MRRARGYEERHAKAGTRSEGPGNDSLGEASSYSYLAGEASVEKNGNNGETEQDEDKHGDCQEEERRVRGAGGKRRLEGCGSCINARRGRRLRAQLPEKMIQPRR
ncbi:hypothetical protein FS749_006283 [Ceratobasidium sp. UAMH 11750]|nr:hypothetical protein FS749_006283 [Ceratobasidium sp. UAMH 11750]